MVAVAGTDRVGFLQGLVSNDMARAAPGHAVWAALLSPQGKWLADFFVLDDGARLLLDCERAQDAMLVQRLGRYRLRAQVAITDETAAWSVYAAWDGVADVPGGCIAAPDPRLPAAGWRILSPAALPTTSGFADWDRHRITLGLPDGSRDMEADKSVLLEAGFDALAGISFTKGCYMGQELTARTKYRGLLKRRLMPVRIEGPPPVPGTLVMQAGAEIGTMRSVTSGLGMALLRLGADGPLVCGEAVLTPQPALWMATAETQA